MKYQLFQRNDSGVKGSKEEEDTYQQPPKAEFHARCTKILKITGDRTQKISRIPASERQLSGLSTVYEGNQGFCGQLRGDS